MTIGEVCLPTNDVPRLAAFYKQLLGVENGSNDETHQFIISEGTALTVYSDGTVKNNLNRNICLAFTVDDIDREYEKVLALGAEIIEPLGVLAGRLLATLMKPAKKRVPLIFVATGLVFSGNIIQSLTSRPWLWCAAAFGSYLMATVMNINMDTLMREKVPTEMQGRVFSAKSTLQNFTIPPALLLGGLLADTVIEPFMTADSPLQQALSGLFGTGKGAGIGLMFFIIGIAGMLISFTRLRKPVYRELDRAETDTSQIKPFTEEDARP